MSRPDGTDHTFQTFWHGGSLTPYEQLCFRSFVDHGHAVHVYSYDPDLLVPDGVEVHDAGAILPAGSVFVYEHDGFGKGSVSAFSNLFRYKLLRDRGGWWIDTDVVCLTDTIGIEEEQYFAMQDDSLAAPGTMRFPAGSAVPTLCFERASALGRSVKWGDGGPRAFTAVLEEAGLLSAAAAPSGCYPVHFSEALDLLRPARAAAIDERLHAAMFLHLWNSTLVHAGVDKWLLPPTGSALRAIADRHPVQGWLGEYDDYRLDRQLALSNDLAEVRAELAATRRYLDDVMSSTSWRLTRPLRRMTEALRRSGR